MWGVSVEYCFEKNEWKEVGVDASSESIGSMGWEFVKPVGLKVTERIQKSKQIKSEHLAKDN
jgi:hypothetical protein